MSWKVGPLPAGKKTWNWGGIVTKASLATTRSNLQPFQFASFKGDHAVLVDGTIVKGEDIGLYNNDLMLPTVERIPASTKLIEAE